MRQRAGDSRSAARCDAKLLLCRHRLGRLLERHDADRLAAAPVTEEHVALGQREQRVVATAADEIARVELRAPLAQDDLAGVDQLTAEPLHTETLSVGVAAVAGAGRTLFVSHGCPYFPLEMPVTLTRVSG